jgi:predicted O-linked N-acetylglucosamine transferase (SPINDLY family)
MKLNIDQSLRKAASLSARGDIGGAEAIYRDILDRFPANRRAIDGLQALSAPPTTAAYTNGLRAVLDLYDRGRLHDAIGQLAVMIGEYPAVADLHNLAGAAHAGLGQWAVAVECYDQALRIRPDHAEVHNNRGVALLRLQRLDEALRSYDEAIRLQPDHAEAWSNRGIVLRQLQRLETAADSYEKAILLRPGSAEMQYNLGNVLLELKRQKEAIACYDKAIGLKPDHAAAHSNRGNALKDLKRLGEALDAYGRAIGFEPGFAEAHSNRGIALLALKRFDDALDACTTAVRLQPDEAAVHYNLGTVLQEMRRLDDALHGYGEAIRLKPDHAIALTNRGIVLQDLDRLDEAVDSYRKVIALTPRDATAYYNLGNALQEILRLNEATSAYAQAVALKPDYAEAISQMLFQRARMCRWDAVDADLATLGITTKAVTPFTFLAIEDDARHHMLRAKTWMSEKHNNISIRSARPTIRSAPIRIGYFSADFHNHATMHLMARLFELHDRRRFEIHVFSYGVDRKDDMNQRTRDAVDVFHDVGRLSDKAVADLARKAGIDIAIDLKGHTKEMRAGIFSHRAAPIQITYLGYPGSSGAAFIDYIIADDVVIPEASREFYTEKVISLPYAYQVNDSARAIADRTFQRVELGLPETGFVFCSFNNNYKITPAEFDIWMRLLARVDGSVLWLLRDNEWAETNLRKEAQARGVDPGRLIFADRMALPDHLARHRCADLFLDSFNCNGHTTASDALWAGLPIVTRLGESFAARVAGSLLHAIGMPELVTETALDYERMALDLATNPDRLATTKAKLAANRMTTPLFDTEQSARHIECAYELAYDRYYDGLRPDHIVVPAVGIGERAAA